MQPTPHIGVILLCGQAPALARATRDSLTPAGHRSGLVWGAVEEGHAELLELEALFGKEHLVRHPAGCGRASRLNRAAWVALEAGADYLLFLEDGVCLAPGALTVLLIALEAQKRAGAVCPALLEDEKKGLALCGGRFSKATGRMRLLRRRLRPEAPLSRQWAAVDFAPAACALLRRELFEDVGFFHESYGSTGFEAELGQRARTECWETLCVPQAQATLPRERTAEQAGELAQEAARTPLWLVKACGTPVRRTLALPVAMLGTWPLAFAGHLLRGRFRCAGSVVRGSFLGLLRDADPREGSHLALPLRGRKLRLSPPSAVREMSKYL